MGTDGAQQSSQRAKMFVAHLWFLTHTGVRQGDNLGTGLFRRSYDAEVAEWHAELDQRQRAQRLTCTCESDTFLAHALFLAAGGYADDLVRTSIVRSYKELNDINQLTTSSLATAWDVTILRPQSKHSFRDLRAASFGDWKAQSAWSLLHDAWDPREQSRAQ